MDEFQQDKGGVSPDSEEEGLNFEAEDPAEGLLREIAQLKDQWLRAEAETENTRRRLEKEKDELRKYAVSSFASRLLSIADNLRRALAASPEKNTLPAEILPLVEGVELIEKELLTAFESIGVAPVESLGKIFDPHYHQVLFEVEEAAATPGTIVQVLQEGYTLQDRLLRPALVGVAKKGI